MYLGPSEENKGDNYIFLNPLTYHSIESCSVVFLQKNYGDFHKIDKSKIATQIAENTDELTQTCDKESYVSVDCQTIIEEDFIIIAMIMRMKKTFLHLSEISFQIFLEPLET
jgi:hypothetical protein